MIDLAKQHRLMRHDLLQPFVRFQQGPFGLVARVTKPHLLERLLERAHQEIHEVVGARLDHVIGGAGFQRCNGDSALVGARDVDDGGTVGAGPKLVQRSQPVLSGHVVVDRYEVEGFARRERDAFHAARRAGDDKSSPREAPRDQPAQPLIVVDVQQTRKSALRHLAHAPASGTWITDKNRPSWRIASENDS